MVAHGHATVLGQMAQLGDIRTLSLACTGLESVEAACYAVDAVILLLDSEPVVRSVMKEVLEQAGYVVVATGGLGEAVKRLADGRIDLLITRPYVDNIPGHQAAKYLRARNPRMEVLVIAGLLDDDRLRYRAALERFEVFPKPFSTAELLEKVEEVLKAAQERAAR